LSAVVVFKESDEKNICSSLVGIRFLRKKPKSNKGEVTTKMTCSGLICNLPPPPPKVSFEEEDDEEDDVENTSRGRRRRTTSRTSATEINEEDDVGGRRRRTTSIANEPAVVGASNI
jgi:hypothetical protein